MLELGEERDAVNEEEAEFELVGPSKVFEDHEKLLSKRSRVNSSLDARAKTSLLAAM